MRRSVGIMLVALLLAAAGAAALAAGRFERRFAVAQEDMAVLDFSDPQQEFAGKNLLYVARSIDDIAKQTGRSNDQVVEALHRARLALFEARLARPRPHRDDKLLTAWNGLMIGAIGWAIGGMLVGIVLYDQLFFRPLLALADKFRFE